MFKVLAFVLVGFQMACSHSPSKQASQKASGKTKIYKNQIRKLETTLNKQAKIVQDLRSQNEKLKLQMGFESPVSGVERDRMERSVARDLGPDKLFSTFLSAHNSRRTRKEARALYLLQKTYPNSPLLAEAIYLRGKRDIENKKYKRALKKMNRVIAEFPNHSRARSAMLAKSVVYRRLNLKKPSISVLEDLVRLYPKTEEARKAQSHLALMQSGSIKE